jgi:hypothetical protein
MLVADALWLFMILQLSRVLFDLLLNLSVPYVAVLYCAEYPLPVAVLHALSNFSAHLFALLMRFMLLSPF